MRDNIINRLIPSPTAQFYNAHHISLRVKNSLLNSQIGMKAGRLDGIGLSLREAQTCRTRTGHISEKRIRFGLDAEGRLILVDGRHLLEAYRLLGKDIANSILEFDSPIVKKVFTSTIA